MMSRYEKNKEEWQSRFDEMQNKLDKLKELIANDDSTYKPNSEDKINHLCISLESLENLTKKINIQ